MPWGKKRSNAPTATEVAKKSRAPSSQSDRPQTRSSGQLNEQNERTGSRDDSTRQADSQDTPPLSSGPQPLTRDDIPALVMEVVKLLTPAVTTTQASAQGTSTSTTFTGVRELTGTTAVGMSTNITTGDT